MRTNTSKALDINTPHFNRQSAPYKDLSLEVLTYIENSVARSTTRARESDINTFLNWGGHLPSTPEEVANFFAEQAKIKAVATVERYRSSLNHWHGASDYSPHAKVNSSGPFWGVSHVPMDVNRNEPNRY